MLKKLRIRALIAQFQKNHPQYSDVQLATCAIPKGQHYVAIPADKAVDFEIGQQYRVVPTEQPVIYGPSLIIAQAEPFKILAVFPM